MTKFSRHIFILAACVFLSLQVYPQQSKSAAATKKNEQVKEENKKAYEKARKKTIKHRREIQTKETRKRMDEADKRAEAYNRRNHKKWYQDIFKKKKYR
jgi:hypothetical protein